jgi:uncharacterized membrane protein YhfC
MLGLCAIAFVCFLFPIGITIINIKKSKISMKRGAILFLAGALSFFVSQICIRLPLLQNYFSQQVWFIRMSMQTWFVVLFYAGTAGLVEGIGRKLGLRLVAGKTQLTWFDGVIFGLGHGGCEAILLVGINGIYSFSVLGNQVDLDLLLASFERLCAMAIHVFLSVLIAYGITQKRKWCLAAAVLLHTFVDGLMLVIQLKTGNNTIALAAVAVVAMLYMIAAFLMRRLWVDKNLGTSTV